MVSKQFCYRCQCFAWGLSHPALLITKTRLQRADSTQRWGLTEHPHAASVGSSTVALLVQKEMPSLRGEGRAMAQLIEKEASRRDWSW